MPVSTVRVPRREPFKQAAIRAQQGPDPDAPQWRLRGLCSNENPDLFSAEGHPEVVKSKTEKAKKICGDCPVSLECLVWAMYEVDEPVSGIFGGTTEDERKPFLADHLREEEPWAWTSLRKSTDTGPSCTPCSNAKSRARTQAKKAAEAAKAQKKAVKVEVKVKVSVSKAVVVQEFTDGSGKTCRMCVGHARNAGCPEELLIAHRPARAVVTAS